MTEENRQRVQDPNLKLKDRISRISENPEEAQRLADIEAKIAAVRQAIAKTEGMAKWLDKRYLDPIIGGALELVGMDWLGDVPTTLASLYIVWKAKQAGLPNWKIIKMLAWVGFDFAVDLIPILGGIADFFIKANVRNVEIMKKYAEQLEHYKDLVEEGLI